MKSQSTYEKVFHDVNADFLKFQDTRVVDWNMSRLNNGKGFTVFDYSTTGCLVTNLFPGGYSLADTTHGSNELIRGYAGQAVWRAYENSLIYRDNVLAIYSQYFVPAWTSDIPS